jgi:beta-galactosidase
MLSTLFNDGWGVRPVTSPFLEILGQATPPAPVTLPHDWLHGIPRSADNHPGALNGFHGDGLIAYTKTITASSDMLEGRVELEFDGVYRDAMVYVNDSFVAQRPYGYVPFSVRIDRHLNAGDNEIRVECRNHADARWYSGLGIYRDVRLLTGGPVHVARNGVKVRTVSASDEDAVLEVSTTLENDATRVRTVRVITEIVDPSGAVVASEFASLAVRPQDTAVLRQRFSVDAPERWNLDSPQLYTCRTRLVGENVEDAASTAFGIRTLEWDSRHGLRLNDVPVKLRGGCVHHDNGVIGAVAIGRAEERRIELLKAAGYNAIRSAHNPLSLAMIEACDRLGMLVMDEFTDGWISPTLGFGYGLAFNEWWRRDLSEVIERDINHPSVIMYSIGNEVMDTGFEWGATLGRDMVDLVRTLDPSRPVTNGVNPMMTSLHDLKVQMGAADDAGVNSFMRDLGSMMGELVTSDLATDRLEEAMSQLDIAGYNYAHARYGMDLERHPQRLIVGTESIPAKLDEAWTLVESDPRVLGDFAWTAWEYVGEAGLGADKPAAEGFFGAFPWRLSGTGDIGITGHRRTISYWREIVWGLRAEPYIAVHRPDVTVAEDVVLSIYTWSNSVSSWTWTGFEETPLVVDVYSDADEVELLLDGVTLGRVPAGRGNRFMATFSVPYVAGELSAVAYRAGSPAETTSIRTASSNRVLTALSNRAEIREGVGDLAYVDIAIADHDGIVVPGDDVLVTVTVEGAGVLQGLGNDDPRSDDHYAGTTCHTFLGRALAVIRPTAQGDVHVTIESQTGDVARTSIKVL